MTEGSVWRHIVRFALPVFWGNLFQQLYNVVDSLVVGNFLGSDALAAVGSSSHLIFLLVGLFSGIFTGASVVISRYYGARDDAGVRTPCTPPWLSAWWRAWSSPSRACCSRPAC